MNVKKNGFVIMKKFSEIAKNPLSKDLFKHVGLGTHGEFAIAITHGANRKSGIVIQRYLKIILRAINFLEFLQRKEKNS